MKNMRIGGFAPGCLVIVAVAVASARAGQGPTITLQPVQPTTIPFSTYPPGTTIVGQEITLGSLPARVWLEIHITGWAPHILKSVRATIDIRNGLAGANAVCMVELEGGTDLRPAFVSCPGTGTAGNSHCMAELSGSCTPTPTRCVGWDGSTSPWYPAGFFCQPSFQDTCHTKWALSNISGAWSTVLDYYDLWYGFAADQGQIPPDFMPSYIGTLVVDVPATAKGTFTIGFDEKQCSMENQNPPGANDIPIAALIPAKITIPCGRCCHGVGGENVQCVEAASAIECAAFVNSVFTPDEVCPGEGGPVCAECLSNVQCGDRVFCNGDEECIDGSCAPGFPPCGELEDCEEEQQRCAPRIPAVSNWGMVVMVLALAVAAKLRYANRRSDGA